MEERSRRGTSTGLEELELRPRSLPGDDFLQTSTSLLEPRRLFDLAGDFRFASAAVRLREWRSFRSASTSFCSTSTKVMIGFKLSKHSGSLNFAGVEIALLDIGGIGNFKLFGEHCLSAFTSLYPLNPPVPFASISLIGFPLSEETLVELLSGRDEELLPGTDDELLLAIALSHDVTRIIEFDRTASLDIIWPVGDRNGGISMSEPLSCCSLHLPGISGSSVFSIAYGDWRLCSRIARIKLTGAPLIRLDPWNKEHSPGLNATSFIWLADVATPMLFMTDVGTEDVVNETRAWLLFDDEFLLETENLFPMCGMFEMEM